VGRPIKHYDMWRIRPLDADGKRHSETFATFPEAQRRLRQLELEAQEIKEGRRARVENDHRFGELCDYWLERRAIHKRSRKDDISIIRAHLRPFFGDDALLRDIGVERVDAFLGAKCHLHKQTVVHHLTLLKSMLNLAVDLAWLHRAPKIKKPRIPLFSHDYRFLRTDDELARFLRAAEEEGEAVHALYATAVYTGMRAGELGGLRWDDVDFERRLITVQRSFDGPTKAGDVRYVPILDALLPVLRNWRLRHPGVHVFTSRDGAPLKPSGRIYQEVLHRVLTTAGFPPVKNGASEQSYINFHCLRHTFASHWVMKAGDLFKLQKILGHKNTAMTMRYAHLAPHAFAEDHARFTTVRSVDAAVVALHSRGKPPAEISADDVKPDVGELAEPRLAGSQRSHS